MTVDYVYLGTKVGQVLILLAVAVLLVKSKLKPKPKATDKFVSINKDRKKGHWRPESFKTPTPPPFPYWDIEKTRPVPYRAFKHEYKVNMGIRNMDWDDWIQLDNQWMRFHNDKLAHVRDRGSELYATAPEAADAAYELLEEFREWLPARYPTLFEKTPLGLDNKVTGEKHVFMKTAKAAEGIFSRSNGINPMYIAAMMTQDDLAIMIEGEDGDYYLKAGAIMLAGFWRLKDKLNMPLSEIHTSGDVPKYTTHLKPGMEKFFQRISCDKPVVRNNYFIQTDPNLPWSLQIGDEGADDLGWYTAEKATTADQIYFRSERQSLRRLPRSGGVVFTIRTYFHPLTEICEEPYIPRRLLNGINSWSDDVAEYKGLAMYKEVILEYLELQAREQEARGYTRENEPQVYPF